MEQRTGSKSGKEYIKAVYCHPVYLASMQSTSWEMLDWMKHKLDSRLQGEISINSGMQMTPHLRQKAKRRERLKEKEEKLKSLLMKVEEDSEKVNVKLNI